MIDETIVVDINLTTGEVRFRDYGNMCDNPTPGQTLFYRTNDPRRGGWITNLRWETLTNEQRESWETTAKLFGIKDGNYPLMSCICARMEWETILCKPKNKKNTGVRFANALGKSLERRLA